MAVSAPGAPASADLDLPDTFITDAGHPSCEGEVPRPTRQGGIERLMKRAVGARTSSEANALIDELGKKGEDAVYAIEEVVNQTRFERVRAHGLVVIRDLKSEDTKF